MISQLIGFKKIGGDETVLREAQIGIVSQRRFAIEKSQQMRSDEDHKMDRRGFQDLRFKLT